MFYLLKGYYTFIPPFEPPDFQDAIDQSDLRRFLESVGFKPRNTAEREVMNNLPLVFLRLAVWAPKMGP